jgi:hypothetical protein
LVQQKLLVLDQMEQLQLQLPSPPPRQQQQQLLLQLARLLLVHGERERGGRKLSQVQALLLELLTPKRRPSPLAKKSNHLHLCVPASLHPTLYFTECRLLKQALEEAAAETARLCCAASARTGPVACIKRKTISVVSGVVRACELVGRGVCRM